MPDFHEILKKFRTEKNITQANMSKLLGLTRSTYSLYELGRREPNIDTLKKNSQYLRSNTGRTDRMAEPKFKHK